MTSPAGRGLGTAFVNLRADVTRFASTVRIGVNRTLRQVENYMTHGRFPNAVRNAAAQAGRDFARIFNTFANNINIEVDKAKLTSFLKTFGKITLAVGAAANALTTLTPAIAAVGAAIATVGAAAASTIPFLISGFLVVSKTLKLAFKGVGDAISAIAEDDVEKLDEALKKLSPSARTFVKEIAANRPMFKRLQQDIQESFFKPLVGGFTELINSGVMNTLRKNMVGIAQDAGDTARKVLRVFSAESVRPQLEIILRNTRLIFADLLQMVPNLARGFLTLAAAAAPLVQGLTKGLGPALESALAKLTAFVQEGGVQKLFTNAGEIIQAVVSVLADLGAIVGAVFGSLLGGANQAAGPVGALLDTIRQFVESQEGSKTLEALGAAFQQVGVIVSGVLKPLLPVIGKVITALAGPLLSILEKLTRPIIRLAEDIGVLIGRFLEAGGPVIDKLIEVLTEFAVQALGAIAKHIEELGPLFTEFMKQLGPQLIPLVEAFGDVLLALIPLLPAITDAMLEIIPALIELMPLFTFMVKVTTLLWQGIAILIGFLAELLGWIVKLVASALRKYLEFISFMIGTVWPEVFEKVKNALTAWFEWWINNWKRAIDFFSDQFDKAKERVTSVINFVRNAIGSIPGILSGFVGRIGSAASAIGRAIGNGIAAIPGFAVDIAQRIVDRIRGFTNSVIGSINSGIARLDALVPFSLPRIPFLAEGAVVDSPTLAVLGERGREVVLPLTDPERARQLAHESGLASMLGNFGDTPPPVVHVYIGDEEIIERVDVRIMRFHRGQARELAYGARGV